MMDESAKQKLIKMKVPELIEAFDEQEKTLTDLSIPFAERFKLLVDSAYQYRYNSTVQKLIKAAKLRYPLADIASVHYTEGRELKSEVINELATCNFIAQHKAVVLKGPSGSGKTWIACTLAKQACKLEYNALYIRTPDLFDKYEEQRIIHGGKEKFMRKMEKCAVLVLDEWLLHPLSNDQAELMLEIMEKRYDKKATIFCTQYDIPEWYDQLHTAGVTKDALMDRIVHKRIEINMGNKNMREQE